MLGLSTKTELEEMFLRKKPVKLLMALKMGGPVKYISMLSKETDCTYSHTVKLLDNFKQLGLVSFDNMGRVKYIKLTADGDELAGYFENVLRKLSKINVKQPEQVDIKQKQPIVKPIPVAQPKQSLPIRSIKPLK